MSQAPFDFDPTATPRHAGGRSSAWLPVIALLLAATLGLLGWQWYSARQDARAEATRRHEQLEWRQWKEREELRADQMRRLGKLGVSSDEIDRIMRETWPEPGRP